jgi:hypothetical protein
VYLHVANKQTQAPCALHTVNRMKMVKIMLKLTTHADTIDRATTPYVARHCAAHAQSLLQASRRSTVLIC